MLRILTVVASCVALLPFAVGECPNACSGHGACGANDACMCYDNYMGADCSERVCPFGLAWVDTPLGDLNHDGEIHASVSYPSAMSLKDEENSGNDRREHLLEDPKGIVQVQWANKLVNEYFPMHDGGDKGYIVGPNSVNAGGLKADSNEAHFYAECSGRGICGRDSGTCSCFDGFDGASCQRMTCPNSCSGHGMCMTVREIAKGRKATTRGRNFFPTNYYKTYTQFTGVDSKFEYDLWDADKATACVCDRGYFGPDCSQRDCPRGNDPLTNEIFHCGNQACTSEVQSIIIKIPDVASPKYSQVQLLYQDVYGDPSFTLRSAPFKVDAGLDAKTYASMVQLALSTFPDSLLSGVNVSVHAVENNEQEEVTAFAEQFDMIRNTVLELKLDFKYGPQGDVNPIHIAPFPDGSTPGAGTVQFATIYDSAGTRTLSSYKHSSITSVDIFDSTDGPDHLVPKNGNTENSPCSNRGICDYSAGTCSCFSGYTGSACQIQDALAI